ncbi:M-phase inducer phosphatase [Entamoeba marina]
MLSATDYASSIVSSSQLSPCRENTICQQITCNKLVTLLKGGHEVMIFDCRYDYEYQAGHIQNAQKLPKESVMKKMFFERNQKGVVVVFLCEFSKVRAVNAWKKFREMDREYMMQHDGYPSLAYPHTYLLRGGFKKFYSEYPDYCIGWYCKMNHKPSSITYKTKQHNPSYVTSCSPSTDSVDTIQSSQSIYRLKKSFSFDEFLTVEHTEPTFKRHHSFNI